MRRLIRQWILASLLVLPGTAAAQVVLNELRSDQPGVDVDEFFELSAAPDTSLDGLTYLVIGDGAGGGGVIEAVVPLDGLRVPASGFFVAAEASFTLGPADLVADLAFENADNVTHLLVRGFTGSLGQDLDVDEDGVLETLPWEEVVDALALVLQPNPPGGGPPAGTEFAYVLDEQVGPDGARVPSHVGRCPDRDGPFEIAIFDVFPGPAEMRGQDTPGAPNACRIVQEPLALSIPAIQGAGHGSPFVGQSVRTHGVVTAVDTNAFYLQDPAGDDDVTTSDAVLVFSGARPEVRIGDRVEVVGQVTEFVPGGVGSRNLSTTELTEPQVTLLGTAAVPPPVVLGAGGRQPPTEIIDDDAFTLFDPSLDGIDFYESLEAMRVTVRAARSVAPTNRFGEIYVVVDEGRGASGRSARGTLNISPDDFNPERIQLDVDAGLFDGSLPRVPAGVSLGDVTGVVSYAFGNYEVQVTEPLGVASSATHVLRPPEAGSLEPEVTTLRGGGRRIRIASFNLLNLDPNDDDGDRDLADGRFDAIAQIITERLLEPDIVALQEVQDDDGSVTSSVVGAGRTLQQLVDAIAAHGGGTYAFLDNPFVGNGTNGGQPGGNIRVAYLYDPARVELDPDSVETVVDPQAQQTDPANPFFRSRLPLSVEFRVGRQRLRVVNVHLSSKGGSAPLFGRLQPATQLQEDPAVNGGVDTRRLQAAAIAGYVQTRLSDDAATHLVVLGDFNEFEFVSPLGILGENLTNLTWLLPDVERYSFVFEGNSQSLDHILVSPGLKERARFDVVHVNSEFPETASRASDHDPVLAELFLRPVRPGGSSGGAR